MKNSDLNELRKKKIIEQYGSFEPPSFLLTIDENGLPIFQNESDLMYSNLINESVLENIKNLKKELTPNELNQYEEKIIKDNELNQDGEIINKPKKIIKDNELNQDGGIMNKPKKIIKDNELFRNKEIFAKPQKITNQINYNIFNDLNKDENIIKDISEIKNNETVTEMEEGSKILLNNLLNEFNINKKKREFACTACGTYRNSIKKLKQQNAVLEKMINKANEELNFYKSTCMGSNAVNYGNLILENNNLKNKIVECAQIIIELNKNQTKETTKKKYNINELKIERPNNIEIKFSKKKLNVSFVTETMNNVVQSYEIK